MVCKKCGAATKVKQSTGGIKNGRFKEIYECAHGHKGFVSGIAQDPDTWDKYGQVFDEW